MTEPLSTSNQSSSLIEEVNFGNAADTKLSSLLPQDQKQNLLLEESNDDSKKSRKKDEASHLARNIEIAINPEPIPEIDEKGEGEKNLDQKDDKRVEEQPLTEGNTQKELVSESHSKREENKTKNNDGEKQQNKPAKFLKEKAQQEFKMSLKVKLPPMKRHKSHGKCYLQKIPICTSNRSRHLYEIIKIFQIHQHQINHVSLKDKLASIQKKLKEFSIFQERDLEKQEIDYLYLIAEDFQKSTKKQIYPYESIFPSLNNEQIISQISQVVEPFFNSQSLRQYHRVKIDYLLNQIIPFLEKYGKQNRNQSQHEENIENTTRNKQRDQNDEKQNILPFISDEMHIINEESPNENIEEEMGICLQRQSSKTESMREKEKNKEKQNEKLPLQDKEYKKQALKDLSIIVESKNIMAISEIRELPQKQSISQKNQEQEIQKTPLIEEISLVADLPPVALAPIEASNIEQQVLKPKGKVQEEEISEGQSNINNEIPVPKYHSPKFVIKPIPQTPLLVEELPIKSITLRPQQIRKVEPEINLPKQIIKVEQEINEQIQYKPKQVKQQYKLVQNVEDSEKQKPPVPLEEIRKMLQHKLDPTLHETLKKLQDEQLREIYQSVMNSLRQQQAGKRPSPLIVEPAPQPEKIVVLNTDSPKRQKKKVNEKLEVYLNKINEMLGEIRRILREGVE